MTTSPTPHFPFRTPPLKYDDQEPLALTVRFGNCRDLERWHSRREFLKSYNLSSGRSSLKEKLKRSARKIGLRVYRLTLVWPSVFVVRCHVPFPCMKVQAINQDHLHSDRSVLLDHVSHGYVNHKSF